MSFETIPHLLADILSAQRATHEAVVRLAEAIAGVRASAPAPKTTPQATPASAAPSAASPAPSAASPAPTAASPSEAPPAPAPAPAAIDFESLKKAFLALSTKEGGRARCESVLKPFGLARLSEAKADQYPGIMAAISKASA